MKRLFVFVGLLAVSSETALAEVRYDKLDLSAKLDESYEGAIAIDHWSSYGMNNNGLVIGRGSADGGRISVPFVWSPEGGFVDLSEALGNALLMDVNNRGQIVGRADFHDDKNYRLFVWDPNVGKPRILKEFTGFPCHAVINDLGQIALTQWDLSADGKKADNPNWYLWDEEGVTIIENEKNLYPLVRGINNKGTVIGSIKLMGDERNGQFEAVTWDRKNGIQKLNNLPDNFSSFADAINDREQITGRSIYGPKTDLTVPAVLWEGGAVRNIGVAAHRSETPRALNNRGECVGSCHVYDNESGSTRAVGFYWSKPTGMQLIDDRIPTDSKWRFGYPIDINDKGWILTGGFTPSGTNSRLILLTPSHSGSLGPNRPR